MASQDETLRDQQSVESLEHGGLPVSAQERIAESEAAERGAWTSDLSVAELVAVRHWGFEPAGMVMGSSVYHIGSQWGRSWFGSLTGAYGNSYPCPHGYYASNEHRTGYNWEHTVHEKGMVSARDLAMSRLVEEARELGAHGVIGVRLIFKHLEGVNAAVEFTAIGTAIRRHDADPLHQPFTSDLSGQDFGKLMSAGYVPVSLVMGLCAMEVDPGCGMEWNMSSWGNVELDQYTDAAQSCREIAVQHLEREAMQVGADGVVGVNPQFTVHELTGESKVFQLLVLGTAVARYADAPLPEPPLPMLRLAAR